VKEASDVSEEKKKLLKERIRNNYLWENVARETLSGYESILKANK